MFGVYILQNIIQHWPKHCPITILEDFNVFTLEENNHEWKKIKI
jgi:hypothetical protein